MTQEINGTEAPSDGLLSQRKQAVLIENLKTRLRATFCTRKRHGRTSQHTTSFWWAKRRTEMVALGHMTPIFSHLVRFAQPMENSSLFPPDISKLSVIKDRLPDHVTYGHIKLVITILELSCQTASCSAAVTPQRKGSFSSSGPPAKVPNNSRSSSQDTARKLPVWLSGKPGGKRKNPF